MAPAPSVGKLTPNLAMDTEGTRLVNLTVLQRVDPAVEDILITADHVTLYDFNIELSQWSRRDVEGSLFVVKRNTQPRFQFIVMNRRNTDKASMLDEIIDRVKFLQLQVKVLNMSWLGAPRAVVPLLTESQPQGHSNPPLSAPTISQGLLDTPDLEDGFTFEQGVMKLMETSITSAMQYLQNKVLCLMPIALASAISNQEGIAAAAIPPEK